MQNVPQDTPALGVPTERRAPAKTPSGVIHESVPVEVRWSRTPQGTPRDHPAPRGVSQGQGVQESKPIHLLLQEVLVGKSQTYFK